jgi:copper chaperone
LKNLYLLAFLALFVFAIGCGKSGNETTGEQNNNINKQDVKKEESKQTDSKQTDTKQTDTKENTAMNNSGEFKSVEIKTKGMFCSHCENTVKTSVTKLDGVKEVIADAKTNTAIVTFDESKTNVKAIEEAIVDAGYEVLEPGQ